MKGFQLTEAIRVEVSKKGTAGGEVKVITDSGEVYDIISVEDELQPDGFHILWLKVELSDG